MSSLRYVQVFYVNFLPYLRTEIATSVKYVHISFMETKAVVSSNAKFMFRMSIDKGLDLALLEHRHAGMLFALIDENREHLRRWLPWVDHTRSVSDSASFVQGALEQFARSQSLHAGIFFHGSLAGIIGYHTIDWANRRTALGYWLAAPFQGHGVMTRATRAMTTHAFSGLALHRVEIRAATENKRSRAVAERAGFKHEGTCRGAEWLHERFVDHMVYGVLAPEWKG
jgi:ribosomal-protein-serine acetyltransferase